MTVHAPENAAEVKLEVMRSLGASVVIHPFGEWWDIMCARSAGPGEGLFVHPVCEPGVIVGNGTIVFNLPKDWPTSATVLVRSGEAGLSSGSGPPCGGFDTQAEL